MATQCLSLIPSQLKENCTEILTLKIVLIYYYLGGKHLKHSHSTPCWSGAVLYNFGHMPSNSCKKHTYQVKSQKRIVLHQASRVHCASRKCDCTAGKLRSVCPHLLPSWKSANSSAVLSSTVRAVTVTGPLALLGKQPCSLTSCQSEWILQISTESKYLRWGHRRVGRRALCVLSSRCIAPGL